MRVIDADELERILVKDFEFYPAIVRRAIQRCRTIDIPNIIRCRNCKYCKQNLFMGNYWCNKFVGKISVCNPDGFCEYGEMKNGR